VQPSGLLLRLGLVRDGRPDRLSVRPVQNLSQLVIPVFRARSVLLSLVVAPALAGGALSVPAPAEAAPAAAAARAERGWITGVVVDADGHPLAGRLVNALDAGIVPEVGLVAETTDRRDYTDAQGRFRVRQAPGGTLVQVCHPEDDRPTCKETVRGVDHVITYVGGGGVTDSWVTQRSLLPSSGSDRDLGEVEVKPKARVHGTIEGGAGVPVRIMRLNDTVAFTTWTDRRGRYDLDGMVPGTYYLAAGGEGTFPWRSAEVTLTADHDLVVDGSLDRGVVLTGRVERAGGSGKPVPGVELRVLRNGEVFAATGSDERGRFVLGGLTPGRYEISPYAGGSVDPTASRTVTVRTTHGTVRTSLTVRRGASVSVDVTGQRAPGRVTDELRDAHGVPVLGLGNDGEGRVSYSGLAPGRYTVVVSGERGFALRSFRLRRGQSLDLGAVTPARRYLTVRGRTAPHAVVEATTGDLCPAGEDERYGSTHEIERADARGRFVIRRLVPGRYMLGADHYPGDHAPRCVSGVRIREDRRFDLPLTIGAEVTGRLVYADTQTPVITTLSYALDFAPGSWRNPTGEHPARGRSTGASGRFHVGALRSGEARGALAWDGGEEFSNPADFVYHPTQDGTPYWLETQTRTVELTAGETTDLGDVEVVQH
jgi:hypothetical protein